MAVAGRLEKNYRHRLFYVGRCDSSTLLIIKEKTYQLSPGELRRVAGVDADISPTTVVLDVYRSFCVAGESRNVKILVGNFCMQESNGRRKFVWQDPKVKEIFGDDPCAWIAFAESWGLSVGLKKVISNPLEDPMKFSVQFPNFHH